MHVRTHRTLPSPKTLGPETCVLTAPAPPEIDAAVCAAPRTPSPETPSPFPRESHRCARDLTCVYASGLSVYSSQLCCPGGQWRIFLHLLLSCTLDRPAIQVLRCVREDLQRPELHCLQTSATQASSRSSHARTLEQLLSTPRHSSRPLVLPPNRPFRPGKPNAMFCAHDRSPLLGLQSSAQDQLHSCLRTSCRCGVKNAACTRAASIRNQNGKFGAQRTERIAHY